MTASDPLQLFQDFDQGTDESQIYAKTAPIVRHFGFLS